MSAFVHVLSRRLENIRAQGLWRELRPADSPQSPRLTWAGQEYRNFSSNDYLGLANDPLIREAACRAVEKYGVGSGSARLVSGSLAPHHELETALAAWKKTEATLTFTSGYATALGTITALIGKDDVIILDKLVHACIVDAARLSGAKIRVYDHNDLADLERILQWAAGRPVEGAEKGQVLIVTESIFSMDGDAAPLREIVALKNRYGAWLMVDEAHATGLYGPNRCGLAEELGVSNDVEIQMGTLGKALGSAGGYISGAQVLCDLLVNRARSFIFSTAPVPAAAAAARAAIAFLQTPEGEVRRQRLWQNVARLQARYPLATARPQAILPVVIGDEAKTVEAAAELRARGYFIPAIRYPTVARGAARLRITLTAVHTEADIDDLAAALQAVVPVS